MHNMYHSNHQQRRSHRGSRNQNRNNFGRRNQNVKKLDSNLFIKQAAGVQEVTDYVSVNQITSLPISERIKRNISERGYKNLTEIQDKSILTIIEGRDLIGIANTGTGKTAAFLIPLINKTERFRNERVLIVAPTRELANQIMDEFKIFAKGTDLEAVLLIGGSNLHRQEARLKHSPHYVIGTPGRMKDLVERGKLNLTMFPNVVLDEVDRMLDIGFIHDIKFLISKLPKRRQSLFFSATLDKRTNEILQNFVTNPVTVSVKVQETSENIEQNIIKITDHSRKVDTLHDLIAQDGFDKVMIFGRTKWGIEKLSKTLINRGFRAASIHGNKSQGQRQRALDGFKNGDIKILLATDVASRGLDIDNVTHVINYDAPASYEDYVHRIGRTGRAGRRGIALTFVE
ncbi:MAG: DEAD/DEAH box helicase [Bacteroidia bacterium]|nr:MAG: DEAD/DEAH box helicase [Bacteroidia bacterium]